jgi:hypothetical protein
MWFKCHLTCFRKQVNQRKSSYKYGYLNLILPKILSSHKTRAMFNISVKSIHFLKAARGQPESDSSSYQNQDVNNHHVNFLNQNNKYRCVKKCFYTIRLSNLQTEQRIRD